MPIPAHIIARGMPEDAAFGSIAFAELRPDGRYGAVSTEEERVVVGQTVILRYTRPKETTIQALCGLTEADSFEAAVGTSATLNWHRSNVTAVLVRAEVKRILSQSVAEATLTFLI
jgi:hypothetical protein